MKLLFDQNISYRILNSLPEEFKDSKHVSSLGLNNASDFEIWNYAKRSGFAIVSFDSDFINLATFHGHPPKVLLIKTGNRKTLQLSNLLTQKRTLIVAFLNDEKYGDMACLEIIDNPPEPL